MSHPPWTSLHPTPHPTRLGRHRAWSWAPCADSFPLSVYFTHGRVCMRILISQLIPASPSPAGFTCFLFMSMSPFLPWKQVHLYHFSIFHIHALMCDICFSNFTLYDRLQVHSGLYKWPHFVSLSGMNNIHCIYVPHLLSNQLLIEHWLFPQNKLKLKSPIKTETKYQDCYK